MSAGAGDSQNPAQILPTDYSNTKPKKKKDKLLKFEQIQDSEPKKKGMLAMCNRDLYVSNRGKQVSNTSNNNGSHES